MLGKIALILSLSAGAILDSRAASSDVGTNVEDEVRFLREQNRLLQEQGGELNTLAKKSETWRQLNRRVKARARPPAGRSRPKVVSALAGWIWVRKAGWLISTPHGFCHRGRG